MLQGYPKLVDPVNAELRLSHLHRRLDEYRPKK
jgi:hypothetical protein